MKWTAKTLRGTAQKTLRETTGCGCNDGAVMCKKAHSARCPCVCHSEKSLNNFALWLDKETN